MIPVEDFVNSENGSRGRTALHKAMTVRPTVTPLGPVINGEQVYRVERTDQLSRYLVILYIDPDGQVFIECGCFAGTPMTDLTTQLPAWQYRPCFHAAAVILSFGEQP